MFSGWKAVAGSSRIDLLFIKASDWGVTSLFGAVPWFFGSFGEGASGRERPARSDLAESVTVSEREYTVINAALSRLALCSLAFRENMCGVELCLLVCDCVCVCVCVLVGCLVIKADQTR